MAAFQQWGWLPVDAERNIYDERLRLATRIDLIVVELATKRVIWIELKSTGSEEEYGPLSSDPFFLAPLQDVTCCPQNVHQLQLLTGMLVARKRYKVRAQRVHGAFDNTLCYKGMVPDAGYVVRVHTKSKQVSRHAPPAWAKSRRNQDNLYAALRPSRG